MANNRRRTRNRMTPTAYDPGAVIRLGLYEGFRFLVILHGDGSPTISAAYMTRRAADKHANKLAEHWKTVYNQNPAIVVVPIDKAWDDLRHNMYAAWTVWLVNHLMWYASIYGGEEDMGRVIGNTLAREHRTIQQGFMRLIRTALETYIKNEPGSDLRNEGALDWAHRVLELPHNMPLI